tara:strand:+ start:120 stop:284 length:165 start_codon:yes stop_codon:yes gene_type:complete
MKVNKKAVPIKGKRVLINPKKNKASFFPRALLIALFGSSRYLPAQFPLLFLKGE